MEKNYIISKCDDSEFCFQPQGNSLIVLLDNDEKVCVLNETSRFLYENCSGKTVENLCKELFEIILDKESLSFDMLMNTRLCDKIIVMKEGRIIEQGSHNQLMAVKGEYYKMFTAQQQFYK